MKISVTFPFVDLRKFIQNSNYLYVPSWPRPKANNEFIRYFGAIRNHKAGEVGSWADEGAVCRVTRGLKFQDDLSYFNEETGEKTIIRNNYINFYFDGLALGKFEFVFSTKSGLESPTKSSELIKIIKSLYAKKLSVRNAQGAAFEIKQLGKAQKKIVSLYHRASTVTSQYPLVENWHVQACTPLIFVELDWDEDFYWMSNYLEVALPERFDANLNYAMLDIDDNNRIPIWTLTSSQETKKQAKRTLKLYLTRLHAEHECMKKVLTHITNTHIYTQRKTKENDSLQAYLNTRTKKIAAYEKRSKDVFHIDEIEKLAKISLNIISPGEKLKLLHELDDLNFRKNIDVKVREYIENWDAEIWTEFVPSIFISYRRSDTDRDAGRLHDSLTAEFGNEHVFQDIKDIPIGVDFRNVLMDKLMECNIVLVLMGKNWISLEGTDGIRRLDAENDFVRTEIEIALSYGLYVVPVFVDHEDVPREDQLPESIKKLAFRNAIFINTTGVNYDRGVTDLISRIKKLEYLN